MSRAAWLLAIALVSTGASYDCEGPRPTPPDAVLGNSLSTPADAWHSYPEAFPGGVDVFAFGGLPASWFVANPSGWISLAAPQKHWWILLGTTAPADLAAYEADLEALVELIVPTGGFVHLVQSPRVIPFPPFSPAQAEALNARIAGAREAELRVCAHRYFVACGPDLGWQLLDDPALYLDGVHPNPNGHVALASAMAKHREQ